MATDGSSRSSLPELHELEFAIMEQVWQLGRTSVHEVHDKLNASDAKQRAYTTVLSVMRRLHQKGFLTRERADRVDYYTQVVSRDQYAHAQTRAVLDSLVDQYGDIALAHFARKVDSLSLGQLAKLRTLTDEE